MGTVHAKAPSTPNNPKRFPRESGADKGMHHRKQNGSSNYVSPFTKKETTVHLNSTNMQTVRARVDKVHIDGLKRTKDDIVAAQVTDLFKAQNFGDVILRSNKVKEKLGALGCFQSIEVFIDTSQGPDATPDGIEVTFAVNELRRMTGQVSSMIGNNEGSVTIGAKAPNLFGRGESLQMEYSHGIKSSSNVNVSAVKPFVDNWLHAILTGSIFSTSRDYPWSGFKESDKGFLIDVALGSNGATALKHNLQWEAAYRQIIATKQAAFGVREQCGPNLKSALKHICSIDKRDSAIFPTVGSLLQFSTELAGFGGDIGFVKNEFIVQTNWTPHEFLTFQLGVQSGLLRGINNDLKINITDHFFLGGPLNVRGFSTRGCGPQQDGNALGGDAYWAAALHVYTPLPFRPGRGGFGDLFRLHGFINGGNVSKFKFAEDYKDNLKFFTENVRCTVGGGIAMSYADIARFEINVTLPLLFARSDILQHFQFGFGMQYL